MADSPTLRVEHTDDASEALAACGELLLGDPVAHNVALTILGNRVAAPAPGRYWWVSDGDSVVGFAWQSPPAFKASVTPTSPDGARALADAMLADGADIPGVLGDAATAAAFTGRWTEQTGTGATVLEGQRIYRLDAVAEVPAASGSARPVDRGELPLLGTWADAFAAETGDTSVPDIEAALLDLANRDLLWVWDDDGVAAMAKITDLRGGVVRVGLVYTPVDRRGAGYATALVADLSRHALHAGADACILYTQLANAGSNRIYRRIGYRSVGEVLAYRFD